MTSKDTILAEADFKTWMLRRGDFDFSWVVMPRTDMPFPVDQLKIGPDDFGHSLISQRPSQQPIYIPNINVNPSAALRWRVSTLDRDILRSGIYQVVAGYHHYGARDVSAAFYIMRCDGPPSRFRTMQQAYDSKLREKLPSLEGADPADYINFHKCGSVDNSSLGCFTCPDPIFTRFRDLFEDLEVGLMIFARTSSPYLTAAIKETT